MIRRQSDGGKGCRRIATQVRDRSERPQRQVRLDQLPLGIGQITTSHATVYHSQHPPGAGMTDPVISTQNTP
jgi:hypothetical protein